MNQFQGDTAALRAFANARQDTRLLRLRQDNAAFHDMTGLDVTGRVFDPYVKCDWRHRLIAGDAEVTYTILVISASASPTTIDDNPADQIPVATGRAGSATHSLHDPGYNFAPFMPATSSASKL